MEGPSLIARLMGPTWGPSGADRTQVGLMLAQFLQNYTFPYFLLIGLLLQYVTLIQSRQLVKFNVIVNWCGVAVPNVK